MKSKEEVLLEIEGMAFVSGSNAFKEVIFNTAHHKANVRRPLYNWIYQSLLVSNRRECDAKFFP